VGDAAVDADHIVVEDAGQLLLGRLDEPVAVDDEVADIEGDTGVPARRANTGGHAPGAGG